MTIGVPKLAKHPFWQHLYSSAISSSARVAPEVKGAEPKANVGAGPVADDLGGAPDVEAEAVADGLEACCDVEAGAVADDLEACCDVEAETVADGLGGAPDVEADAWNEDMWAVE